MGVDSKSPWVVLQNKSPEQFYKIWKKAPVREFLFWKICRALSLVYEHSVAQ